MDLYSVSFRGVQLNNDEFSKVTLHDFDQMPQADQNIAQITAAHRSTITSKWYTQKIATVDLFTKDCTVELQAKMARIRQVLQGKTGDVVLDRGVPIRDGSAYEYDQWTSMTYMGATLESVEFDLQGKTMAASLTFILLNPIGLGGTDQTLFSGTGITSDNTYIDLTTTDIQGTFEIQYPVYSILVNDITLGDNPSLTITNQYNTLVYSGELEIGDVLELDTYTASLKRNGNLVDYSGSIPSLPLAGQAFNITDTYTDRDFDITMINTPRYI